MTAAIVRDEALFAQQQVVRLQALLEASRRIHSTIALDEVLHTALQIVCRELELTGAWFTGFPPTYGTLPAGFRDRSPALAGRSLAFPLRDKAGDPVTELVVLLPPGRTLNLDESDFLESLAVQAAVAIENARFHERTVEWQRIESDLDSARLVQRSLLPQQMPSIPGYTVALRSQACYEVGGDYLDIVPTPSGHTTLVVADVAGKGLASALVGTSFRSAFRAMVNSGVPLVDIATRINLLHYNEGSESRRRYVTAIFLQLDPASDSIEVVNCGHNPGFLATTPQAPVLRIAASGTPVGMLPFSTYQSETHHLPPGARLLLYTDGLTEVFQAREEFGEERLLDAFTTTPATTATGLLEQIWQTIGAFSDGQEQTDDMTALVLLRQA